MVSPPKVVLAKLLKHVKGDGGIAAKTGVGFTAVTSRYRRFLSTLGETWLPGFPH